VFIPFVLAEEKIECRECGRRGVVLIQLGVRIRRFINNPYVSAPVTRSKAQCNVDFWVSIVLSGIGDRDFSLSHLVPGRFGIQRIVALWNCGFGNFVPCVFTSLIAFGNYSDKS
jgi:hypothetical protein